MAFFSLTQELAMDLGTANTIIINNDKIVVDEPSIVALDRKSEKLVAVGHEAKAMQGRNPENIRIVRPLRDGVIADFNAAEKTGGEKKHTLTIDEMPSHNHELIKPRWNTNTGANAVYGSNGSGNGSDYDIRGYQGGDQAHNNMPPFITVYFWKRTA